MITITGVMLVKYQTKTGKTILKLALSNGAVVSVLLKQDIEFVFGKTITIQARSFVVSKSEFTVLFIQWKILKKEVRKNANTPNNSRSFCSFPLRWCNHYRVSRFDSH